VIWSPQRGYNPLLRRCPLHFSGPLPQLFNAPLCAFLVHKRLYLNDGRELLLLLQSMSVVPQGAV
jgi:hypothetical protein